MWRAIRDNGLGLLFGALFLTSLLGQSFAGQADFNNRQVTSGSAELTWIEYVTSSDYAVDVSENWQSEYLQFFLFIWATVWVIQRGSPESKPHKDIGLESDKQQLLGRYVQRDSPAWAKAGGWRTTVFSSSLGLVMAFLFLLSWLAQSVAGQSAFNAEQLADLQLPVSWPAYLLSADFWNRSLQNWQSEFLAIGSMAVLSVYLRQRGSPESKPVGAPHQVTSQSG
jgi:uncharacterized protein DUF6766